MNKFNKGDKVKTNASYTFPKFTGTVKLVVKDNDSLVYLKHIYPEQADEVKLIHEMWLEYA